MSINKLPLNAKELLMLKRQAGNALHRTLIMNESFPSCVNCMHWEPTNELCKKFDSHPPAEVIVYSCGVDTWEPIIPF